VVILLVSLFSLLYFFCFSSSSVGVFLVLHLCTSCFPSSPSFSGLFSFLVRLAFPPLHPFRYFRFFFFSLSALLSLFRFPPSTPRPPCCFFQLLVFPVRHFLFSVRSGFFLGLCSFLSLLLCSLFLFRRIPPFFFVRLPRPTSPFLLRRVSFTSPLPPGHDSPPFQSLPATSSQLHSSPRIPSLSVTSLPHSRSFCLCLASSFCPPALSSSLIPVFPFILRFRSPSHFLYRAPLSLGFRSFLLLLLLFLPSSVVLFPRVCNGSRRTGFVSPLSFPSTCCAPLAPYSPLALLLRTRPLFLPLLFLLTSF